jgi:putative FmdB family regulatory protein
LEEDMPLFEFSCLECGLEFESLVLKYSEISDIKCPACNGKKLEEKVSSFASVSKAGTSSASNCSPSGG